MVESVSQSDVDMAVQLLTAIDAMQTGDYDYNEILLALLVLGLPGPPVGPSQAGLGYGGPITVTTERR